jgi:hypothetical protein
MQEKAFSVAVLSRPISEDVRQLKRYFAGTGNKEARKATLFQDPTCLNINKYSVIKILQKISFNICVLIKQLQKSLVMLHVRFPWQRDVGALSRSNGIVQCCCISLATQQLKRRVYQQAAWSCMQQ